MRTRAVIVGVILVGCTSPSASPSPTSSQGPVASSTSAVAAASAAASQTLSPIPDGPATVLFAAADGLRVREQPSTSAGPVDTLHAGQLMGVIGGPTTAEGMDWYEIRVGPGDLRGWVAAGPEGEWLRRVDNGQLAFGCDSCFEDEDPTTVGTVPGVVVADPTHGSALAPLAFGTTAHAWSPDGNYLAVTFAGMDATTVAVLDPSGNRRDLGFGAEPAWSPDGERLAWMRGPGVGGRPGDPSDLVVVEVTGWSETELSIPGLRLSTRLSWSPDGQRLALAGLDCSACPPDQPIMGDPPSSIFTLRADGGGLRQLTRGGIDGFPHWSPDGSHLLFVRYDLSGEVGNQWHLVPADGGDSAILFEADTAPTAVAWSPDGLRLAAATANGLVIADAIGEDAAVLVPTESPIYEAIWSPDGRSIAYLLVDNEHDQGVWLVAADGTGDPVRVSPPDTYAGGLNWQPILSPLDE